MLLLLKYVIIEIISILQHELKLLSLKIAKIIALTSTQDDELGVHENVEVHEYRYET